MHQIRILVIRWIILARHKIGPVVAERNTTSRAALASFGSFLFRKSNRRPLDLPAKPPYC
jgi:hypothetical protein